MKPTTRATRRAFSGKGARWALSLVSAVSIGALSVAVPGPAGADSTTASTTAAPSVTSTTTPTGGPAASVTTTTAATTGPTGTVPTTAPTATSGPPSSMKPKGTALINPMVSTQLNGAGSSFAAPAIEAFTKAVAGAPYNLHVNYSSTNSGDGRYEFANNTTNYAASDIAYNLGTTNPNPPSFPFIYVPITAGGIAFMYNIPGLTKPLQLSSYSACGVLTGGIAKWNDPAIVADNPGVALPSLTVQPITESDSAGTNYVLEEWCINEQPALWTAFANHQNSQSGGPGSGVTISATAPNSNWPGLQGGLDEQSTSAVASAVATNPGAMGAVQVKYATDLGFGPSNPSKGVAPVKNASGQYAQPSAPDVASALAYAKQLPNGTHQLDFNGLGPNVYNPSTYSYLLVKTAGSDPGLGAVLSGFVNYSLTLGQQTANTFSYASLGLSLEKYGVDQVKANVPGAVAPTAAELAAYSCGDLTPADVQAGKTTPTCGNINPNNLGAGNTTTTGAGARTAGATGAAGSGGSGAGSGSGSGSGSGGSGSGGVNPGVSLSGSTPLAFTGGDPIPLVVVGGLLMVGAWVVRRRLVRRGTAEVGR